MSHFTNRPLGALAALGVAAVLLAGCSAPQAETETTAGQLPQKYVDAGVITASTICGGEPMSFCEPGSTKAIGLFADIAEAWGDELGVDVDPIGMAFDAILPSTASGRFDIVLAIGDTEERQAQFDFIDILYSSDAIVIGANETEITEEADLCGRIVSTTTGSVEAANVDAMSAECVAAGDEPIENLQVGDLGASYLAVSAGRADAAYTTAAAAYTLEKQNPDLYSVGFEIPSDTLFAIAIPNTNPELRDAIAVAFNTILENGKYQEVLDKWNLGTQGVSELMINREPAEVPGQ
jgi:polar amino acid transport system substrate-binding protein